MRQLLFTPVLLALFLLPCAVGCSGGAADANTSDAGEAAVGAPTTLPESFWSSNTTADAKDVFTLREEDLAGQTITVRGTVKDFVEGLAAFVLVEDSLLSCDEIPGDSCPTPWDYCCTDPDELARGTAFVEFHDDGRPGEWAVEGFHGIERLSEVVVTGELSIDEADNLSLVATSIRLQ
ncbi:MAG: hypothetical protein AAF957_03195 [Planctomycetota bacterium]